MKVTTKKSNGPGITIGHTVTSRHHATQDERGEVKIVRPKNRYFSLLELLAQTTSVR